MIRGALASTRSLSGALASTRAGGIPPYLAGGAPNPVAVYDPMGAASLAASYVNIVNPGTFDAAPGVAPTWAAGTGWTFNLIHYLTTGYNPPASQTKAMLIRCDAVPANPGFNYIAGVLDGSSGNNFFGLRYQASSTTKMLFLNGDLAEGTTASDPRADGVAAVAGASGYWNGVDVGVTIGLGGLNMGYPLIIGGLNSNGTPGSFSNVIIKYVIVWDTSTDHATWMPAVSAAVAAL